MSGWGKLPEQVKRDLIEWFNVSGGVSVMEMTEMARMYQRGQFHAWNCPKCNKRVFYGEPKDWSMFQGVQNADYSSYPGNPDLGEYNTLLCDDCRCFTVPPKIKNITYKDCGGY